MTPSECPRCTGRVYLDGAEPVCWSCGWRPTIERELALRRRGIKDSDGDGEPQFTRRGARQRKGAPRHQGMRLT